jgi:type I restriction enzyme S subunit
LAAAQAERESRRDRLAAASLHGLNNGGDDDIFRKHARFHLRHLPRLTTRAEHVKQLRQTILNVAVRGRLVSQNHNDEPAIDLLERIHAERARLVKDGKTRKQQPLTPMGSGTIPFDVPEKWIWARLPDLCHVITDGEHLTPEYSGSGIPILSAKHIGADQIIVDDYKLVSRGVAEKCWARCFPEERDILVVSRGAGVGRTIVSGRRDYCLMGSVLLFKPASLVNEHFLCTFLNSAIGNEKLRATSGASAQQAIYIAHLKRDYVVPLPPLAEQQRIVAKVDELMALCDRLEAQLTTTEFTRHQLLEATIHEAISGQVELQQSARR